MSKFCVIALIIFCQQITLITLFFSHGVFFIAHKIHKIHKSAHVTLVLASGMHTLGIADSEGEATRKFREFRVFRVRLIFPAMQASESEATHHIS